MPWGVFVGSRCGKFEGFGKNANVAISAWIHSFMFKILKLEVDYIFYMYINAYMSIGQN